MQKERSILEFKAAIGQQEYDSLIEKLIEKAYTKALDVTITNDNSVFRPGPPEKPPVIRIKHYENKRLILYDLMHEIGHLFDKISLDATLPKDSECPRSERNRERRAWKFADEEIKNHPELDNHIQEYSKYKKKRLECYGIFE